MAATRRGRTNAACVSGPRLAVIESAGGKGLGISVTTWFSPLWAARAKRQVRVQVRQDKGYGCAAIAPQQKFQRQRARRVKRGCTRNRMMSRAVDGGTLSTVRAVPLRTRPAPWLWAGGWAAGQAAGKSRTCGELGAHHGLAQPGMRQVTEFPAQYRASVGSVEARQKRPIAAGASACRAPACTARYVLTRRACAGRNFCNAPS